MLMHPGRDGWISLDRGGKSKKPAHCERLNV
jgi:hypothetical protein